MSKAFYTEKDIEALVQRGVQSLEVTDAVVLTELAYEKARQLGLRLVAPGGMDRPDVPPSAPVRLYISKVPADRKPDAPDPAVIKDAGATLKDANATPAPTPAMAPQLALTGAVAALKDADVTLKGAALKGDNATPAQGELAAHIRKAVIARLGDQVEASMLDAIIARVLNATGMK